MDSFWKNRRTFVTGSTGFVGAHIVRRLMERGANVFCLQRTASLPYLLQANGLTTSIEIIKGDIQDFNLIEQTLNHCKIDTVFHLAGQSIVDTATHSPVSTFDTNIRATYLLLESCRQNPTVERILVASSDRAYGSHSQLPYLENFALQGLSPYDVSKSCSDLISQSFVHNYNLPISIVRAANIYGEGDLNASRIIPGTIISILKGENPIIRSDGSPIRDFVHIDDISQGYLLLAEKIEEAKGEAFNFGTNQPVQMLALVNKILSLMNKSRELAPQIMQKPKVGQKVDAQYISAEKAEKKLGWKAKVSLEDGLSRTIEWYRQHLREIS